MRRVTIRAAAPDGRPVIYRLQVPRSVTVLEAHLPRCGPHGQPLDNGALESYIVVRTGRPYRLRRTWPWKRLRSGLHTVKRPDGTTEIRFYKHSASAQSILSDLARQGLFRLKVVAASRSCTKPSEPPQMDCR